MDPYRLKSLVFYAVAALLGAALMGLMSFNAVLAVGVTVAIAAVADRFINHEAEPDERMRSFVVYLVGAVAGLLLVLMFGTRLGSLTFITPVVGFGVAALFEYFVPPAGYQPKDPHRYGESPPVTVR
jgi:hypothetical protein